MALLCSTMKEEISETESSSILSKELSIAQLTELYIESLSPKEKKSYLIARDHLGTSFSLEKSVGFLAWKSKQKN